MLKTTNNLSQLRDIFARKLGQYFTKIRLQVITQ